MAKDPNFSPGPRGKRFCPCERSLARLRANLRPAFQLIGVDTRTIKDAALAFVIKGRPPIVFTREQLDRIDASRPWASARYGAWPPF